jgi:hypothetical protein
MRQPRGKQRKGGGCGFKEGHSHGKVALKQVLKEVRERVIQYLERESSMLKSRQPKEGVCPA